jgi:hypothetical protein
VDHDPERSDDAIVGVFARRRPAEACVKSLHDAGFAADQVGFAGSGVLADGVVGGGLGAVVAGGIASALDGVGMAARLAASCEDQVRAGHFLVTVHGHRLEVAAKIVAAGGGQVEGPISRGVSQVTGTVPAALDPVEGMFNAPALAEAFAEQLRAAFPDRLVVVEEVGPPPVQVVGSANERRPRARVIVRSRWNRRDTAPR